MHIGINGIKIPNLKPAKEFEEKGARLQKEIFPRKKGGKNRRKSVKKFAHISEHIASRIVEPGTIFGGHRER